jgi:hypothetical protein
MGIDTVVPSFDDNNESPGAVMTWDPTEIQANLQTPQITRRYIYHTSLQRILYGVCVLTY